MMQQLTKQKYVLISDFDGTISKNDFFRHVTQNLLSDEDMEPWERYKAGEITHVKALSLIFSKIKMSKDKFNEFIDTIKIEEYFIPTVNLCIKKNIDFYVISAGADYYIKRLLNNLDVYSKVKMIANPSCFSEEIGLQMQPPSINADYYDANLGVSKKYFVQKLKQEGYFVIFAGDGTPDIEAAAVADKVFAKDYLITLCENKKLNYTSYTSYADIYHYILNCYISSNN